METSRNGSSAGSGRGFRRGDDATVRPLRTTKSINAQILSAENQELLRIILERKPESIHDLEIATGRRSSNLSRTLKTLARYGIVELSKEERSVIPVVKATEFKVTFGLNL